MSESSQSRRQFLKQASLAAAAVSVSPRAIPVKRPGPAHSPSTQQTKADYTIRIQATPVEIAPDRIVSTITYNSQFPGPLIRFQEGVPTVVDIYNNTDTPEQLHWHGQKIPVDVDGAAEEGTPYIPANGLRRISFTPQPAGLRFYHSHNRAGANLYAGQYTGQVGPV
jgi:FtsP/CotA-like multicopper oxidase with cupredoxin domain